VIAAQVAGRFADQGLLAVAGRKEPRHSIKRLSEIVGITQFRGASMQSHSNFQTQGRRPWFGPKRSLCVQCSGCGIGRRRKCRAKRVATGLEHVTAVGCDRVAQQCVMAGEGRLHLCALGFPQARASLDVGKQEGQRAGGEIGHICESRAQG